MLFSFGVPEENLSGDADGDDDDCERWSRKSAILGIVLLPFGKRLQFAIENHHFNR